MKLCFDAEGKYICAADSTFDLGIDGHHWEEAPEGYTHQQQYKYENGNIIELTFAEAFPDRLRVYRTLDGSLPHLTSDFSVLGFRKMSPSYERGRKTRSEYWCLSKDEKIVEKIFSDIRNESGILTGLQITFNWYNEAGEIGDSKTEIAKSFNKYEAETEERKRRIRQIDYLVAGAKGTPIESGIDTVFNYLYEEVLAYEVKGNNQLMTDKINSVTYTPNADPGSPEEAMNGLYGILYTVPLPRQDDPNKVIYVHQSIKYQIGTMTLAEIEAANG